MNGGFGIIMSIVHLKLKCIYKLKKIKTSQELTFALSFHKLHYKCKCCLCHQQHNTYISANYTLVNPCFLTVQNKYKVFNVVCILIHYPLHMNLFMITLYQCLKGQELISVEGGCGVTI